ncbi:MAG: S-layer family protein [Coleofasciculus chthonoplastes F3-SA18-01]|uniref:two-partner secretion domain-containing protein n=1 Tax=Coleofasciculus chthonoplastes TaxID=64178 RepID=UPI0032FFA389
MKQIKTHFCFASSLVLGFWANITTVSAQVVPDNALPVNSQVTGCPVCLIEGGTVRGVNLFHSFEAFSVQTGGEAFFNNALDIENILGRVTGTNISDIDGLIRANGTANLFLINPNGIIFGENSRLNIGGSFVASTANAISFGNQGVFSATDPEALPLLTVNPDAFFFNQMTSGRIENHSIASAGINLFGESLKGLRVPDGHSLLLLGGDIAINGGGLNALGGRVELAGLAVPGEVALNMDDNHLSLNIPNDLTRADISLINEAVVNTSGKGGGEIQVFGRRVILKEGSQILATTLGSEAGEGITVDASESIELIGNGFESFEQIFIAGGLSGQIRPFNPGTGLFTGTVGTGLGGTVAINTGELILRDGAIIFSPTFGEGSGGSLSVRASESVEAIGSGLITSTLSNATGSAGDITINTKRLIVRDGAVVTTITLGEGTGGKIGINASESVEVLETPAGALVSTGLFANTIGGTGAAGGITIDTRQLIIRGGGQIATQSGLLFVGIPNGGFGGDLVIRASELVKVSGQATDNRIYSGLFSGTDGSGEGGDLTISTSALLVQNLGLVTARTLGRGNGGDLTINTDVLQVDGGQITTQTLGAGKGGNLSVTASSAVELIDTFTKVQLLDTPIVRIGSSGEAIIVTATSENVPLVGLIASTEGSGQAGNVIVSTPLLIVKDGVINVNSNSSGTSGNLEIEADLVRLNNGFITARTASGNGGNLTLRIDDVLLMRRNSQISATAGTAQAGGDGGNINIDAGVIAAVPNENSDITANAFFGQGGRITITSQGIFGIEERPAIPGNRTNDIDASSQFGNSGEITLDVSLDPSRGLTQLPSTLVDPSGQINRTCAASNRQSQFTVTGRGGLPENPTDLFSPDLVQDDFGTVIAREEDEEKEGQVEENNSSISHPPKQIIEAQGWIIDEEGNVVLTAYVPNGTPHGGWQNSVNCQVSETASP